MTDNLVECITSIQTYKVGPIPQYAIVSTSTPTERLSTGGVYKEMRNCENDDVYS